MARGGYNFNEVKDWTKEQWYFIYHYQEKHITDQQDFLNRTLGIVWNKEDLIQKADSSKASIAKDKVFIPLALSINSEIYDFVLKQFNLSEDGASSVSYVAGGNYIPKANEVIKSMANMSKEEFMKFTGGIG